ncbi:MAG: response regulator [Gammaproteobacteria bacterium]
MAATWTVLVADDESLTRKMIRAMLERQLGLIVTEAADGREALEAYKQSHADLVLLDADMPRLNGFEVCEKIRALEYGADVPILMVTSLADSESARCAAAAGATDFVTKPINWATLGRLIQQHLPESRPATAE